MISASSGFDHKRVSGAGAHIWSCRAGGPGRLSAVPAGKLSAHKQAVAYLISGVPGTGKSAASADFARLTEDADMIWVHGTRIGGHGKSEKISATDLGRRLVIQWTAQLPRTRRDPMTR